METNITLAEAYECVGHGWHALLRAIYFILPAHVQVLQVKEKYGGLRVYIGGAPVEIHDAILAIEQYSLTVCEMCGAPGTLMQVKGWYYTRCPDCGNELLEC